jgi:hypothetical protein
VKGAHPPVAEAVALAHIPLSTTDLLMFSVTGPTLSTITLTDMAKVETCPSESVTITVRDWFPTVSHDKEWLVQRLKTVVVLTVVPFNFQTIV